jgi:hypothetical protein
VEAVSDQASFPAAHQRDFHLPKGKEALATRGVCIIVSRVCLQRLPKESSKSLRKTCGKQRVSALSTVEAVVMSDENNFRFLKKNMRQAKGLCIKYYGSVEIARRASQLHAKQLSFK